MCITSMHTTTTASPLQVLFYLSSSQNLLGALVILPDDVALTSDCSEMASFCALMNLYLYQLTAWCKFAVLSSIYISLACRIAISCLLFLLSILSTWVLTLFLHLIEW